MYSFLDIDVCIVKDFSKIKLFGTDLHAVIKPA